MPIHPKHSTARIKAKGIWTLSGPVLWAKKLGINLPIVEVRVDDREKI